TGQRGLDPTGMAGVVTTTGCTTIGILTLHARVLHQDVESITTLGQHCGPAAIVFPLHCNRVPRRPPPIALATSCCCLWALSMLSQRLLTPGTTADRALMRETGKRGLKHCRRQASFLHPLGDSDHTEACSCASTPVAVVGV